MRIISGKFKKKKILSPNNSNTRPLKDLTKESIFNIIKHTKKFKVKLENSDILDLFSGIGSFGLECLSRGSSSITFVENYKEALLVLKKNIVLLKANNQTTIIERNIFNSLDFSIFDKKFEIIFLDPPYKEENIIIVLSSIIKENILKKGGIIILHRHKKVKDTFPKNFKILEEKTYGISKIIFGNYI